MPLHVCLSTDKVFIKHKISGELIAEIRKRGNACALIIRRQTAFFSNRVADYNTWHNRLGHCSLSVMELLQALGLVKINNMLTLPNSETCQLGKSKCLPSSEKSVHRSAEPFRLIHCDLWGPAPVVSWTHYNTM